MPSDSPIVPSSVVPAALQLIAQHEPRIKQQPARIRAAVCVVLRRVGDEFEFLMMQRAFHENDPWSGQMAFPGGKVEQTDASPKAAAMRETFEEVGIDLASAIYVGRLNDLYGFKHQDTYIAHISSFVFLLTEPAKITPNYEVADTVWLPFSYLENAANFMILEKPRAEIPDMPAINIDLNKQQVLWGLSLRILLMIYDLLKMPMQALDHKVKDYMRSMERSEPE